MIEILARQEVGGRVAGRAGFASHDGVELLSVDIAMARGTERLVCDLIKHEAGHRPRWLAFEQRQRSARLLRGWPVAFGAVKGNVFASQGEARCLMFEVEALFECFRVMALGASFILEAIAELLEVDVFVA